MNIEYIPTFSYFSKFVDNWNVSVLDFGSNDGNLIRSSFGNIKESNYTGIDVDKEALEIGMSNFPSATWVHYNRYNPVYNAKGINALPHIPKRTDLIISYSVFTHITMEDSIEIIDHLMKYVDGKMYFTYCNVENTKCVEWFRNRRVDCDNIPLLDCVYLADNKVVDGYPNNQCTHFVSFYKPQFILEKFSKYNPKVYSPPVGWVQDCVELQLG